MDERRNVHTPPVVVWPPKVSLIAVRPAKMLKASRNWHVSASILGAPAKN